MQEEGNYRITGRAEKSLLRELCFWCSLFLSTPKTLGLSPADVSIRSLILPKTLCVCVRHEYLSTSLMNW